MLSLRLFPCFVNVLMGIHLLSWYFPPQSIESISMFPTLCWERCVNKEVSSPFLSYEGVPDLILASNNRCYC